MMQHKDNTSNNAANFSPSDDDLIGYLLGSSSAVLRNEIEAWLAADDNNGDRLCQFATVMLTVSENPWKSNLRDDTVQPDRELVVSDRDARRSQVRFVVGFLSLAATILIIVFSIHRFHPDGLADGQVAMAWADSLTTGTDSESNASMPDWLLENGLASDTPDDFASDGLTGDLADIERATNDLVDEEVSIGFSSDEPPEWMLAAFAGMQSLETIDEDFEAHP